ncbi:hypothetical protein JZ751_004323 [Albula glossodonta]|uniref:Zinc-binding protein A33-like n=1 Tax=Albula glossodonta TaxID=121402 RepID=A0A8T2NA97_9TELE|nr:hypothetical protein JZ751_004323 [Albula glossodonta]
MVKFFLGQLCTLAAILSNDHKTLFDIPPVLHLLFHSFCRTCLQQCWEGKSSRECPICRRKSSVDKPPVNLVLKNIVEAYLKKKSESEAEQKSEARCSLHGEKFLLFCKDDQEPLCLVCQTSKKHKNHQLCPVEEAALDLKSQAQHTERQVKAEFEKLHQFLRDEEVARLAALREEEEQKSRRMKEKIENITRQSEYGNAPSVTSDPTAAQCTLKDPELLSGALIDVVKHLGNLKYRVWEKMLETVQYSVLTLFITFPVTLDPNTAHVTLSLSADLSSVRDTDTTDQQLPDNPERFEEYVFVLGSEGFTSGKHSWEVEVGNKPEWVVGVVNESISRKGEISYRPEGGLWVLTLRKGDVYWASGGSDFTLKKKPQRIRVQLDYDRGEVSFYNPTDMSHIHTLKHTFTQRIFPYFCPGSNTAGSNPEALQYIRDPWTGSRGVSRLGDNGTEQRYWEEKSSRECPICRRKSSMDEPPLSLALQNIVEAYLKQKSEATSSKHKNHQVCPVEEAALDLKEELKTALSPMKEKLERFTKVQQECEKAAEHIRSQAQRTERQVKAEFEKLHQFLRDEEEARLAALREEEEQKSRRMKEKIENITRQVSTLSDKITAIEKAMHTEDISFLKRVNMGTLPKSLQTPQREAQCTLKDPELLSGALIDVAKHLGNLKYRVWEKMLETVQYSEYLGETAPVTLDPNTLSKWLSLSDDLSSVRDTGTADQQLPDNPERSEMHGLVLGSEGFTSGKHSWEVEVGNKSDWTMGVVNESISRKGSITYRPQRGFWVLALRDGDKYRASGVTDVTLKRKPQRIRVELDYEKGEVSFCNPTDMSLIYTFKHTFTERIFPYFSPGINTDGSNPGALQVIPVKVHSFCRTCLQRYWEEKSSRECPICWRKSSMDEPPPSLALQSIVETYLKQKSECEAEGKSETRCSFHGEKLLLYCQHDKETLCLVCQTSKKHKNHQLCPVEEAALELKVELKTALSPMKEKLERFTEVKQECEKAAEHIRSQAQHTERQVKAEFEKLRQFLREEEEARRTALREEEEKKSQKMREKMENFTGQISTLSEKITAIEKAIETEDISFLKCTLKDPELRSGALIDVAKHLGNLKYRVWEKMLETVQYSEYLGETAPVTLDPNTANNTLSLSDDLSSVKDTGTADQQIPDNQERFKTFTDVLGSEGFTSGKHSWEVEVGNKREWDVGVVKQFIKRKEAIKCSPERGFCVVRLRHGDKYYACTSPSTPLRLKKKPQRIRVQLDYEKGEVSFYNPTDKSLIYTFKHVFLERAFPYFSPGSNTDGSNPGALQVCPVKVSVTVMSPLHSFCRTCLQQCWDEKSSRECPICRRKSSMSHLPPNLDMKNIVEAYLKQRVRVKLRQTVDLKLISRFHCSEMTDTQTTCRLKCGLTAAVVARRGAAPGGKACSEVSRDKPHWCRSVTIHQGTGGRRHYTKWGGMLVCEKSVTEAAGSVNIMAPRDTGVFRNESGARGGPRRVSREKQKPRVSGSSERCALL